MIHPSTTSPHPSPPASPTPTASTAQGGFLDDAAYKSAYDALTIFLITEAANETRSPTLHSLEMLTEAQEYAKFRLDTFRLYGDEVRRRVGCAFVGSLHLGVVGV